MRYTWRQTDSVVLVMVPFLPNRYGTLKNGLNEHNIYFYGLQVVVLFLVQTPKQPVVCKCTYQATRKNPSVEYRFDYKSQCPFLTVVEYF